MMERKDSLGKWGGERSIEFNLGCVTFQVSLSQYREGLYWGDDTSIGEKAWTGPVSHQYIDDY